MSDLLNKDNKIKNSGKNIPFYEITENYREGIKEPYSQRFARYFIRYFTRMFGYKLSISISSFLQLLFRKDSTSETFIILFHLFEINRYRLLFLMKMSEGDLPAAVQKKKEFLSYSYNHSNNRIVKNTSKKYLELLDADNLSNNENLKSYNQKKSIDSKEKFYIYGPNSINKPSDKYHDFNIVFTKPINEVPVEFKSNILYLNGIFYRQRVENSCEYIDKIISSYQKIFVSCRNSKLKLPFERAKFPIGCHIAAPMALGRILYDLHFRFGKITCVIEGFDFYLEKESYKNYYPSLTKNKDNIINEQIICKGLADHDFLYNFLYVKDFCKSFEIIDSIEFKKKISLSSKDYIKALNNSRDFKTLK